MENEAAVEDVACSNFLNIVNDVVVLGITVWCEEILYDLNQEKNFWDSKEQLHLFISIFTKSHDIEIQKNIWDNHDAND